ncbi:MAG: PAS domain S-box protein [Candidatus Eisenbacteria bacterium]
MADSSFPHASRAPSGDDMPNASSLVESEARLRATLDALFEGCQLIGRDWRYLYMNAAAVRHGRRPAAELLGRRFDECWPGIEQTELYRRIAGVLETGTADRMLNRFEYPDGSSATFDLRFEPAPEGVLVLSVDVTERLQTEARSRHLQLVVEATRRVSQLVARERDALRLAQGACDILLETRSYRAVWIALIQPHGGPPKLAYAGLPGERLELDERLGSGWRPICWRELVPGASSFHDVRSAEGCGECPLGGVRGEHQAGVTAIRHGDREFGVLGICWALETPMDDEERVLLAEVASDLGYALQALEVERRRSAFAQIVANSTDAMALVDEHHVLVEVNPAYCALMNCRAEDAIGRPYAEVAGREAYDALGTAMFSRALAGDDVQLLTPGLADGRRHRRFEVQCSPVRDADGRITAAVLRARDVTARFEAEAKARESEALRAAAFRHSSLGIVMPRLSDGVIADVNEAFAAIHGCSREELLGRTSLELGLWEDPEQRSAMLEGLRRDGAVKNFDIRSRRKDGTVRDVRISVELLELGGEQYMLGVAEDVTESRSTADQLLARNALLSTWMEATGNGILLLDANDRHFAFNRQFVQLWNIPEALADARDDVAILAHVAAQVEEPAAFLARIRELLRTRGHAEFEEIRLHDGRVLERATSPVFGPGGDYRGRLWQFRDVTERRTAALQRARLEEQLQVSQKMEAIGTLAGGVAHDFNNLLVVILNYVAFALADLPPTSPMHADLREVQRAGERAAELTRQLLAFSRRQVLQPVRLELPQVITGLEKMLRRILGEDIELVLELDRRPGVVLADPGQVEQVLMNLVVNARDAMPSGGRITIRTAHETIPPGPVAEDAAPAGDYVVVSVRDTGSGMDEGTLARIFEPFFTTKPAGRGTGLGLSTTYGIIRQSGGFITVTSRPGAGSEFRLLFPRLPGAVTAAGCASAEPGTLAGVETVLVVEDEPALRGLARRFLEQAGYTVLTATDGEHALEVCARHVGPIHLLLTDVVMPRLGGGRLAQELVSRTPRLRVLYMSGYTDDAIARHGMLEPGMHFLAKPFTSRELLRKIREALE